MTDSEPEPEQPSMFVESGGCSVSEVGEEDYSHGALAQQASNDEETSDSKQQFQQQEQQEEEEEEEEDAPEISPAETTPAKHPTLVERSYSLDGIKSTGPKVIVYG